MILDYEMNTNHEVSSIIKGDYKILQVWWTKNSNIEVTSSLMVKISLQTPKISKLVQDQTLDGWLSKNFDQGNES